MPEGSGKSAKSKQPTGNCLLVGCLLLGCSSLPVGRGYRFFVALSFFYGAIVFSFSYQWAISKQDIEQRKQDIDDVFPFEDILKENGMRAKSIAHAKKLFVEYGYGTVFGRGEAADLLGLTPSPTSELLRKLLAAGIIRTVSGMGKGKYTFAPPRPKS